MSATGLRGGVAKVRIAVAVVAGTMVVSGCAASHYQQVSCSGMSRQSIFLLEAQAVPSATLIPCILPLPGGWSYGGSQVRSGLARFWLDSDRAGSHAAEVRLTRACDLAGTNEFSLRSPPAGLRGYEEPTARQPPTSVRYFVFTGGCVTERLSFTRHSAPTLYDQADQSWDSPHARSTCTASATTKGSPSAEPRPHPAPDSPAPHGLSAPAPGSDEATGPAQILRTPSWS